MKRVEYLDEERSCDDDEATGDGRRAAADQHCSRSGCLELQVPYEYSLHQTSRYIRAPETQRARGELAVSDFSRQLRLRPLALR